MKKIYIIDNIVEVIIDGDLNTPTIKGKFFDKLLLSEKELLLISNAANKDLSLLASSEVESVKDVIKKYITL